MISKYFEKNRTGKIIIVVLLSLVVLFFIINLAISFVLNSIVKPNQLAKVNSSENIRLNIDDVSYSLFSNSLSLNNIDLNHFSGAEGAGDSLRIKINSLRAEINLLHLLFNDGYKFSTIYIESPFINRVTTSQPDSSADSANPADQNKQESSLFGFLDTLSKELPYFSSGVIDINNGTYINDNRETGLTDSLLNFSLTVKEVLLDSSSNEKKKLKIADELNLQVERGWLHFGDMLYKLSFTDLQLITEDDKLSLSDIGFMPYMSDENFFSTKQHRADRFILNIKHLDLTSIKFRDLLHEEILRAENLTLNDFMFDALTNMRLPPDPNASPPKMPNEVIKDIPFKLDINKTELTKGNIYVKELYPYDNEPGILLFGDFYSTISNIKNNETANFNIKTKLTGSGDLSINFNLNLSPGLMYFDYSGKLGSMNAVDLNKFIVISDRVRVNSGQIKEVEFSVDAKGDSANAQAAPIYSNLDISELDDETGSASGILEQFNTFIANTFLIKKNNPEEGENVGKSSVVHVRKEDEAFLEYVWIALRAAVGDVVGFN